MSRLPPILSSTLPPLNEEEDDDDEINSSQHYVSNKENNAHNFERFELDLEKETSSIDCDFEHSNNFIIQNCQNAVITQDNSFEHKNGQKTEVNENIIQTMKSQNTETENSKSITKDIAVNIINHIDADQETDIISNSADDLVQKITFDSNEQTSFQTFSSNEKHEKINLPKNDSNENIKSYNRTKQTKTIESNEYNENSAQSPHFEFGQFKDDSIKIKNKFSNMTSTINAHSDINIEFPNSDYDNFNDDDFEDFVTSTEMNYEPHSKESDITNDNDAKLGITFNLEDAHATYEVNDSKSDNEHEDDNTNIDKVLEGNDLSNENDWASFDECIIEKKTQISTNNIEVPSKTSDCDFFADNDDDDFQGFESSEQQTDIKTHKTLSDLEAELPCIFNHCMPPFSHEPLNTLAHILEGNHIWSSVKTIENTPALKMAWTHCIFRKTLISGLGIDLNYESPRTLLPVFAKQLGMLQPTKLQPDDDYPADPGPLDVCNTPTTDQQPSVPSVQFDWSNSVLSDPFQGGMISYLDLDFFANSFSKNVDDAKTSASIQEEKFLASLEEPIKNEKINRPPNDIFINNNFNKNITTFTGFNETGYDGDEDKKEVIKNLLEMIPDLSFMRAKALMFPMKA